MYVLAIAENSTIYAIHHKIYFNEKQARNALKVLQGGFNPKLTDHYKVFKMNTVHLHKLDD